MGDNMKKKELLILLEKLSNNIDINVNTLLSLTDEEVNILGQIENEIIFNNVFKILNSNIKEKNYIVKEMIKVNDPLITDIIYKQVQNEEIDKYLIETIAQCDNYSLGLSYNLLLNNKNLKNKANYKEIVNFLRDIKNPNLIRFINGIISSDYLINNPNKIMIVINMIKKCQNEHIAFIVYKLLTNEKLSNLESYIEQISASRDTNEAKILSLVITNIKDNNIIDKLFETIKNKDYYEINTIEELIQDFFKNKNLSKIKEKLKYIKEDDNITEKKLIFTIK